MRVLRIGEVGLVVFGSLSLIALMLHTVANALARAFWSQPLPGSNEIVGGWYMPMAVMVGIVIAHIKWDHIDAAILVDRFPAVMQRDLRVCAELLTIVVSALFVWYGFREAVHSQSVGLTAGVSGITVWPVMYIAPVAFTILGLISLSRLVADIASRTKSRVARGEAASVSREESSVEIS